MMFMQINIQLLTSVGNNYVMRYQLRLVSRQNSLSSYASSDDVTQTIFN